MKFNGLIIHFKRFVLKNVKFIMKILVNVQIIVTLHMF